MKPEVIYFHGYGSSAKTSEGVSKLRNRFNVHAIDIPVGYHEAHSELNDFISKLPRGGNYVLVGISLGGYWASKMADLFGYPVVLINPSCRPRDTLSRYGVSKTISDGYPDISPTGECPRKILLAKNDDILDYHVAEKLFEHKGEVVLHETGGHRFDVDVNVLYKSVEDFAHSYIYGV